MASPIAAPRMTLDEAKAAVGEFLLSAGLYSKREILLADGVQHPSLVMPDAVMRPCDGCKTTTTWFKTTTKPPEGHVRRYTCGLCSKTTVDYWLRIDWKEQQSTGTGIPAYQSFTFRKIGQWPAPATTPPAAVAKALTAAQLDLYKKGLTCAAQGYGIGALGYFRRVVEDSIAALLDVVKAGAEGEGDNATVDAVERAKSAKNTDEKLRLVADLVPKSLRPGGVNPLALLHDHYSKGIHALSDEDCLATADQLRDDFDHVFKNLKAAIDEAKAYKGRITRLT